MANDFSFMVSPRSWHPSVSPYDRRAAPDQPPACAYSYH
jgi:hypothetical protein